MSYHSGTPEFFQNFIDLSINTLTTELGFSNDKAEMIANELVNMMVEHFRYDQVYFPKYMALYISNRDRALYAEFNGINHAELAKKYDISVQWVYRIVKRVRAAVIAEKQGDLFNATNRQ